MITHSGIKSMRMDDIATNLGISKRTIYEIVKDKNYLVEKSVQHIFEKEKKLDEKVALESKNIIEAFITYIKLMPERKRVHGRIIDNLKKYYPDIFEKAVKDRNESLQLYLVISIKQGIETELFIKEVNVELTVLFFMDSIFGVFSRTEADLPQGISQQEALKYNILCFFRGISTEKGVEIVDKYLKNE